MTAECLACQKNVSVETHCARMPETPGCSTGPCCKAMTAECLACQKNVSVETHCARMPETPGCSTRCKDEAGCKARAKKSSVKEMCSGRGMESCGACEFCQVLREAEAILTPEPTPSPTRTPTPEPTRAPTTGAPT